MSELLRRFQRSKEAEEEEIGRNIMKVIELEDFWKLDKREVVSIFEKVKTVKPEEGNVIAKKAYERYGISSAEIILKLHCQCSTIFEAIEAIGPIGETPMMKEIIRTAENRDSTVEAMAGRIEKLRIENEKLKKELKEYKDEMETSISIDYEGNMNKALSELKRKEEEIEVMKEQFSKFVEDNLNICSACRSSVPIRNLFCHCETCFPGNAEAKICIGCASHCHSTHKITGIEYSESICACRFRDDICRCRCTYVETGDNFVKGTFYRCRTCFSMSSQIVCEACAMNCHRGHMLEAAGENICGYCDCGKEMNHCKSLPIGIGVNPLLHNKHETMLARIPYR